MPVLGKLNSAIPRCCMDYLTYTGHRVALRTAARYLTSCPLRDIYLPYRTRIHLYTYGYLHLLLPRILRCLHALTLRLKRRAVYGELPTSLPAAAWTAFIGTWFTVVGLRQHARLLYRRYDIVFRGSLTYICASPAIHHLSVRSTLRADVAMRHQRAVFCSYGWLRTIVAALRGCMVLHDG